MRICCNGKLVEVGKRQIVMCRKEKSMQIRTVKKERVCYTLPTSFFRTSKGTFCQRVLQSYTGPVFWNDYSLDLPRSYVGFLRTFPNNMVTRLKSFELVGYPVYAVLLNFTKNYKKG